MAAGAGLARMDLRRFLAYDFLALLLWAGAWTTLGRLFAGQLREALELVGRYQDWALALAGGLVLAAGIWRGIRVLRHRGTHR